MNTTRIFDSYKQAREFIESQDRHITFANLMRLPEGYTAELETNGQGRDDFPTFEKLEELASYVNHAHEGHQLVYGETELQPYTVKQEEINGHQLFGTERFNKLPRILRAAAESLLQIKRDNDSNEELAKPLTVEERWNFELAYGGIKRQNGKRH